MTTVLATPCTAPFMASAIAWAVTQPIATTLIVFATLGLGMASPYMLVGVYPELLRLPAEAGRVDGNIQTNQRLRAAGDRGLHPVVHRNGRRSCRRSRCCSASPWPAGCIARTPLTAEFGDRVKSWAYAGTIVLVFIAISFGGLYRIAKAPADMAWQPFSLEQLKQVAVDEGRTVLVDFSAEWCLNCKFFEKTVLHTKPVEKAIARSGAVTMYADFTKYPPEIDDTIKALRANGVPVIAIFPGDAPYKPIVFRGGYTADGIINALSKAAGRTSGSSIAEASAASTPRN